MTDDDITAILPRWDQPEGYGYTSGFVMKTPEFERVFALPRLRWDEREDLDELVEVLTDALKLPEGTMTLRQVQAVVLEALADFGGCVGDVSVGHGKTLIAYLAGVITESERTAIIVPASLRVQMKRDFEELSKHWRAPEDWEVFSYTELSVVSGATKLEEYAPDCIVLDEAAKARNRTSAIVKRLFRYLVEHPRCRYLAMSGTLFSRSLKDVHHHLQLGLGVDRMPLPVPLPELAKWCAAVDEKVDVRARPGAFRKLIEGEVSLTSVRELVGRRILETPGVVSTFKSSVDCGLRFERVRFSVPLCVKPYLRRLHDEKLTPTGLPATPLDRSAIDHTLRSGFYYYWDPMPPERWFNARRAWHQFVSHVLEREDARWDTPLQVANSVDAGELDDHGRLTRWREERKRVRENRVAHWLSTEVLDAVVEHVGSTPTVVWVDHRALGARLSEVSGWPYFHGKGLDARRRLIDTVDDPIVIASIAANKEGRNLQYQWSRNLILGTVTTGEELEQLVGRMYRPGQRAGEVVVEYVGDLSQAIADAKFIHALTGEKPKVLR